MITSLFFLLVAFGRPALLFPIGLSPAQAAANSVADGLHSPHWKVRRDAFQHLVAFPNHLKLPESQKLLLDLLEKENVESLTSKEDLFEDEDYVAYEEAVVQEIQSIAVDTHARRAWQLLAQGRYNPDSKFGTWLSLHQEALPEVEALVTSRYAGQRGMGVYVLAAMAANGRSDRSMDRATYDQIQRRVRWHIWNDVPSVGLYGTEGLLLMGDPEDASFLEAFAARCKLPFYKNQAMEAAQVLRHAR